MWRDPWSSKFKIIHFVATSNHNTKQSPSLSKILFSVLDFDGDQQLGKEDLRQTIRSITASELTNEEVEYVVEKVSFNFSNTLWDTRHFQSLRSALPVHSSCRENQGRFTQIILVSRFIIPENDFSQSQARLLSWFFTKSRQSHDFRRNHRQFGFSLESQVQKYNWITVLLHRKLKGEKTKRLKH